jgi:hypothetical protein
MSDNKPKIDLKARLGKKTVSTPAAASVPPPMGAIPRPPAAASVPRSASGVPQPRVPQPPFAQPSVAPRIDPTDPYASMAAQAAPSRPAAIRIEMGEEVREAQRRGRSKVFVLALVTAAIGGFIGFTVGGGNERAKGAESAIFGAKELLKLVEDSNKQITELAEIIKSARTKLLQKGTYPQEEVTKLAAINISFKSTDLADKSIGRFKRDTLSMLIDFTAAAEAMNDQKQSLHLFLASKRLQDYVAEQKAPKVSWVAYMGGGPGGPWLSVEPLSTPFPAADKGVPWPTEIEVQDGKNKVKVKRYASGDPAGSEPPFIPVNPQTQGAVCPSDVVGSLVSQMIKMEQVLRGDSTPGVDKTGLIEKGQKLAEQLKKIGRDPA